MPRIPGALAVCALLLALAPGARGAGFTALTGPPGLLSGFAASGDTWVATTEGSSPQAFLSRDGAATWQPVAINGTGQVASAEGPAVGPDGAFYLSVSDGSGGLAVVRMPHGGAEPRPLARTALGKQRVKPALGEACRVSKPLHNPH